MVALGGQQDFVLCGQGIGEIRVAEVVIKRRMTLKLPKLNLKIAGSQKSDLGRHWQPPPPLVDPLALGVCGVSAQGAIKKALHTNAPHPSPRSHAPTPTPRHGRDLPPLREVYSPNVLLFNPNDIPLVGTQTPHPHALQLVGTSTEGRPFQMCSPVPGKSHQQSSDGSRAGSHNVKSARRLPTPLPTLAKVAQVLNPEAVMVRQAADLRSASSGDIYNHGDRHTARGGSPVRIPTGLGLSVIDIDTLRREILGNTFKARKDYGSSLEKNWLRQHREERRKKRQQQAVDAFLKANADITKGFDRAFDSHDDDINVNEYDIEEYERCDSVLVNYSDCDSDHSDLDIVMADGELCTREVQRKAARSRLRRERKFEILLAGNDSSDEEKIQRMSDVDIRALRLRLQKKEDDDDSPFISQTAEQLMAEIQKLVADSKKLKVKKKVRRRRRRRGSDDDSVSRNSRALRARFMSEYSFLVDSVGNIKETTPFTTAKPPGTEQPEDGEVRVSETRRVLDDFKKIVIDGIVIPSTTERDGQLELRHEMNKLYNDDQLSRPNSQTRLLSVRRNSHSGVMLEIPKHDHKYDNGRRKSRRSRASKRTTSEVSQGTLRTETVHGDREGIRESVGDDEVLQTTSPKLRDPVEIVREFRATSKRPSSAQRASPESDNGNDLHTLLAGVDFPAKDIKIQIAERKIRRRRQKALEAARRAAEEAARADLAKGLTDEEEDVCPEELPEIPKVFVLPKYMRRPSELDIFKPLLRENPLERLLAPEVKDYMDSEVIPYMSDLFNEMRNCRYLRWNQRDQKIIQRMLELEILAMG